MTELEPELVTVRFRLHRGEDGWPPAESEGMWAEHVSEDQYRLHNIPWFALGVAADDIVRAQPDSTGTLWVVERLRPSGGCTIRVIPAKDGPKPRTQRDVLDVFIPLGASGEGYGPSLNLVALDVPAIADVARIKATLDEGERDGVWAYEEGCVSQVWSAI